MTRLYEVYLEYVQEEGPIELEPFLEQVVADNTASFRQRRSTTSSTRSWAR